MASNPYVNKVEYAGQTLMDLTNDTVTPSDVLAGETFHDKSGTPQTGNLITHNVYDGLDSTSTSDALSANKGKELKDLINLIGIIQQNQFKGDIDSTSIQPGVYYLGSSSSYTHASLTASVPTYCIFVQFPGANTQMIIQDAYFLTRKRSGSPLAWGSWYKNSGTAL